MKIYKYSLTGRDNTQFIYCGASAKILHAGLDPQLQPCIWLEVDPDDVSNKVSGVEVALVMTGHSTLDGGWKYLNTIVFMSLVIHVYTRLFMN